MMREAAASESKAVTLELLAELAHTKESIWRADRKFIREGGKIILGPRGANHVDIAIFGNMEFPDDAGSLERDESEERLIIKGGSISLSIQPGNKNRAETVKLLRNIAPNVEIIPKDR